MENADTGGLTTLELLNIPVDFRRKLYSDFCGSFALPVSGASNTTSRALWQQQVLLQGLCHRCNMKHLSQVLSG